MTRRAAIYTRISSDREGTELGVQRQEADCRTLAARLDLDVVEVFTDNDMSASSASTKPRPRYQAMLAAVRDGQLDAILAYSNSRLTRQVRENLDLLDLVKTRGLEIRTVASGQYDLSTADGRATALTLAVWDQAEAERTAERVRAAKKQRASQGKWHGGPVPYGYTALNGRLTLNPDEAAMIREAARRVLAGDSLAGITKEWNSSERWTRSGKHWRQANLRSILMNRSTIGENKMGVLGWDPVLDRSEFDRLHAIFVDPARKVFHSPGVRGGKYTLGGGLTVCGVCKKRLITGKHHGYTSIKCTKIVNGPEACGTVTVRHDPLEEFVFTAVTEALAENPRWGQRRAEKDDDALAALETERAEYVEQRRRLANGITLGIINEQDALAESKRITAGLEKVESRVNSILGAAVVATGTDGIAEWRDWPSSRRRNFLRHLIKTIEVYPHPKHLPTSVQRRGGEADEDYADRRKRHWHLVLSERVEIVPN